MEQHVHHVPEPPSRFDKQGSGEFIHSYREYPYLCMLLLYRSILHLLWIRRNLFSKISVFSLIFLEVSSLTSNSGINLLVSYPYHLVFLIVPSHSRQHRSQTIARLKDVVLQLTNTQSSLHSKIDDPIQRISSLGGHTFDHESTLTPTPHRNLRHMKLDVPYFDNFNVVSWIFKISYFFIIMTPVMRRAFKSPPSTWIVWYSTGFDGCFAMAKFPLDPNLFLRWRCVSPSYYNDPKGALFKLIQYKFVNQYLSSLESSMNWIVGLPPHFFLS